MNSAANDISFPVLLEQMENIESGIKVIANSDPEGPTKEEYEVYQSLLNLGLTAQWIDIAAQAVRMKNAQEK